MMKTYKRFLSAASWLKTGNKAFFGILEKKLYKRSEKLLFFEHFHAPSSSF